ncbi:MAG: DUF547 domain-containing protein [Ferruginibacter sp.]
MKLFLLILFINYFNFIHAQQLPSHIDYIKVSQSFLYAVRTGDSSDQYIQVLAEADIQKLHGELSADAKKKAFWLNIYNAFIQKLLTENPGKYKNRNSFFSLKQIVIAGKHLSLDNIEHDILRRSKIKWSLGYLNKLFPSDFEKKFRVAKLDNRIHFALNCGAKSCPPIAYYDPEKIDMQLELATRNYLKSETEYDKTSGSIFLPKIMSWFRGDFGGKKGIRKMLKKYHIVERNKDLKIKFKKYDWTLFLNNYKQETE